MRQFRIPRFTLGLLSILGVLPAWADTPKGLRLDGERFTIEAEPSPIRGVLIKPRGKGPFAAVLISHGMGANAEQFGQAKAREFVKWNLVCIAPEYALSNPRGDRKDFGASKENIRRAKKCLDVLCELPEVDRHRIFAYGNSMGAFLTIGLAGEEPNRLAAAAITAGGINSVAGFAAPSTQQAAKIKTPFCILHGADDTTVPPERSALLEDVLKRNLVACERQVFQGIGHNLHVVKAKEVNLKIEAWFKKWTRKVTKETNDGRRI